LLLANTGENGVCLFDIQHDLNVSLELLAELGPFMVVQIVVHFSMISPADKTPTR
jgi:hypothetical protein